MSKMEELIKYNKLLRRYQKNRELVKINRTISSGASNLFGVILDFSDDLMHFAEVDEFRVHGEVIIEMSHYDSISHEAIDETYKMIMEKEKKLSKSKPKKSNVDLKSWKTLFKSLKKHDKHVIIECEDLKNPSFNIGPIKKVGNNSLRIQNYDATGRLDENDTKIKYESITLVKFNDRYSSIFRKYLKKPKAAK